MGSTYGEYDRLISFVSVHHAVRAEKLLTAVGCPTVMIPTPREIDISCGQCLLLKSLDEERALAALNAAKAPWAKLFSRDAANRIFEKLAARER